MISHQTGHKSTLLAALIDEQDVEKVFSRSGTAITSLDRYQLVVTQSFVRSHRTISFPRGL